MTKPLLLLRRAGHTDSADAELLDRFDRNRDEGAFAELVRRHGPVVYRICRRLAGSAGADDAFQATFLVLSTRTRAARSAGALGGWLVGVAGRVARQMRRGAERRVRHESALARGRAEELVDNSIELTDQFRVLDEELTRLPAALRGPVVLCLLQGRTQEQAAAELGRDARTLRRYLERAKSVLRARLERRGVVPVVAAALVAGTGDVTASVPYELAQRTVTLVFDFLTGGAACTAPPVALAKGVTMAMLARKLIVAASTVALGLAGFGALMADSRLPQPASPPSATAAPDSAPKTAAAPRNESARKPPAGDSKLAADVMIQTTCLRVPAGFCKQIGLTSDTVDGAAAALTPRETLMLNALLRTHSGVEILSRPQMRLGKGQWGFVELGQQFPVVTELEGEVRDGNAVYVAKTESVSLRHKLWVAPDIETSGYVIMRIGADYTEFERLARAFATEGRAPRRATVIRSGTATLVRASATEGGAPAPLELGSVNEHAAQATVRVTDGQTAVLRAAAPVPTAGIVIHPGKAVVKKGPTHEYLWVLTSHVVRTEQDAARVLASPTNPPVQPR